MTTKIISYYILFYGSPEGYQTNRAQISLYGPLGILAAHIRFNDPGMDFENDSEKGGKILMHMPSAMFENVLDVLRNETPIRVSFAHGRGFLSACNKPISGQEELPDEPDEVFPT